jgi:hypothetical protein
MKIPIVLLVCGFSVCIVVGCSEDHSLRPDANPAAPNVGKPPMTPDLQLVDDYLAKWDRFAQGDNELVPFLRENKASFEAALTRLLIAKDRRAPARMVFYSVVQVGGAISDDSELGKAAASILGPDFPVTTTKNGERVYFCGDLFSWWQQSGQQYEAYPLFEDWSSRDFAKRVAIPMYKTAREHR